VRSVPLSQSAFRALVSGQRSGLWPGSLRLGLRLAEVPYTWVVRWRNRQYDRGGRKAHRVGVPVVSVGNLTLGGTGKTPMVEWLARWFRGRGVRVVVVSRGYGAKAGQPNDEALELGLRLPEVPHLQDPDRVAAARVAVDQLGCQLILLDDGFQHRRIARDLDIVLLDALEPFGYGHVFPRGTLREPPAGLKRADAVALSRADMLPASEREELAAQVRRYAPQAVYLELAHAARALVCCTGQEAPLDSLRGRPILAFCGIGNPAGFRHTLRTCGCQLVDFREFPDHHPYTPADVESLAAWAGQHEVAAVLCTHKDLVKLNLDRLGGSALWAVAIQVEILTGHQELTTLLERLLPEP
jgi:tetraacyldisaccharide 4'-kinase